MERLTNREQQVIRLVADGMTAKAVSRKLSISNQAVKNTLFTIRQKLDAPNTVNAVFKLFRVETK